ncbi:MAG: LysR substrate-binding domain-containing protein [Lachnospiraceae bacterium]|nr:LysR substrate-binding domain-containing protein [Lachnospiraceae bacterium]
MESDVEPDFAAAFFLRCTEINANTITVGIFDNTKYANQWFKKEKFVGICGNMHPFAGKTVELTDCIKERLIVREEGSGTRQIFEHVLSEHNFSLENFQNKSCIDDIGLIVGLLEKNCGITFAYRSIAENNNKLATFFIQNEDMQHDFSIVYLDNQYAKDKVLAFLQAEE